MIGQNVIKPLRPSRLGYGQIVLEDLKCGGFEGVQGLDGNAGDGMPVNMWVSIRNVWSSNRRDSPSLVGERVVVQPFVGQHAAEEDEPEGHVVLEHLTLDDAVVVVHAEESAAEVVPERTEMLAQVAAGIERVKGPSSSVHVRREADGGCVRDVREDRGRGRAKGRLYASPSPRERLASEVAVLRWLEGRSSVPIPRIIYSGPKFSIFKKIPGTQLLECYSRMDTTQKVRHHPSRFLHSL